MKRILLIAMFMMAGVVPLGAQGSPMVSTTGDLYEKATDLFRKNKFAAAQHLFDVYVREADAFDVDVPNAVYYAAVCSERLNNDDAEYRVREFMRLYPESDKINMAHMFLGNVCLGKGDYAGALHEYLKVEITEVDLDYLAEYEYNTGLCYYQIGDKINAKKYFKHVADGNSKIYRKPAIYYYADILFSEKKYESADKEFMKIEKERGFRNNVPVYRFYIRHYLGDDDAALRMAPVLLQDRNLTLRDEVERIVGDIYFNRGEYRKALDYYNAANSEAARINRTTQPSWNYAIGYCYYMLGSYDSAAAYLSTFVDVDDSTAQNALYTLGDTYIRLNKKEEARTVFKRASEMNYNAAIQEEAAFNYAKLSCELNPNAYNESIRSFENYLQHYPRTKRKTEIQQMLTSLYCTTRNYREAKILIEKDKKTLLKDATMRQAYQRILVNRGIELFNTRDLQGAAACFDTAVAINATPAITTDALYLSAETQYRLANYNGALKKLERFFTASSHKSSAYYSQALYTAGYVYLRKKRYSDAGEKFTEFLKVADANVERRQTLDVYNRVGDCLYMQKNFSGAISYYDKVIKAEGHDADYAMYQKALSYGAMGKSQEKLSCLKELFQNRQFKNSPLAPKAMMEIAEIYFLEGNNTNALNYYNVFIKTFPRHSSVPRALLNKGLIYYNENKNEEALTVFDQLLSQYPQSDEAKSALSTVENIYTEQGRVVEYAAYLKRTMNITMSEVKIDTTMYMAAENKYSSGDYDNAIKGFNSYLQKFPNGLFAMKAHYYLADAYRRTSRLDDALTHYEWVVERGSNAYTEDCLHQAAEIYFSKKNYRKALENYVPLVVMASSDQERIFARMGIVKCHYALRDVNNTVLSASELLNDPKATDEQKDEIRILVARSYYYAGRYEEAFNSYADLSHSANGDYMGEASFRRASIRYSAGDMDGAERIINDVVANPGSDYWLAKTFILWADIFHRRGNDMQARQTLQSIIDNYEITNESDEEVVNEARQHLQNLVSGNEEGNGRNASDNDNDAPAIELEMIDEF